VREKRDSGRKGRQQGEGERARWGEEVQVEKARNGGKRGGIDVRLPSSPCTALTTRGNRGKRRVSEAKREEGEREGPTDAV